MNAWGGEGAVHEFIFGDQQLHARFSLAIELLARIVVAHPRTLTTPSLAEALGQPPRLVRSLLACLCDSGLLIQRENTRDTWCCPAAAEAITFADVFRSVYESTPRKKKPPPNDVSQRQSETHQGVDILLMQATMAINQVVLQHLQAFDLGRLRAVRSRAGEQTFSSSTRVYHPELV